MQNNKSRNRKRCSWCEGNELYEKYHDEEWGVPVHDDRVLFEFLVLEGAQAGLNWITVLKKRENYRKALDNFDYEKIARYTKKDTKRLLANAGIIRNKLKVNSAIQNAKAFIQIREEFGTFDKYIWDFVNGTPIVNNPKKLEDVPAETEISKTISKDLKKRGFNFVGPTIMYAYMQAVGMVDDHVLECFKKHSN